MKIIEKNGTKNKIKKRLIYKRKNIINYKKFNFNRKYSKAKYSIKKGKKNGLLKNIIKLVIIFCFTFFYLILISVSFKKIFHYGLKEYPNDEITLVTALFQLATPRHKFEDYFIWLDNLLKINRSIVFFMSKNLSEIIKSKRPTKYENKTIWIEKEFSELYFYRYKKEFEKTYLIDGGKERHNVNLFILWNEKMKFLEKAINENYFKSKYFFWIDAGYFRENDVSKYINNWPSINKCNQDPKVILNEIRQISKEEFDKLMSFDKETHNKFMNNYNIAGGAYGGRADYLIKFINYYYEVFKLFMEKEKFIGSEQNLLTITSYLHPETTTRIHTKDFHFLKKYYFEK